jgi:RNA polymerase sigma factor (sigma-70 family)
MSAHARSLLTILRRRTFPVFSDAALLARWLDRRDEAAFAELVGRHGPMVLGVCRRVLGDVQHAEDAFQATFLVLARKGATLRRPEALPGFLYGVALRLAKKARGSLQRRVDPPRSVADEPIDPKPNLLDALSGREMLALVDEEVARLPEVYRLPVLLCTLQDRSVEEAARLLGWGIGSVRGRLARGKQRLRERLARRGVCLSAGVVALMVPAAVPESLKASCLRNLAAPAAPSVQAIATGYSVPLPRICLVTSLILVVTTIGASVPLLRTPEPETPSVVGSPDGQEKLPRLDRLGDPLPTGAVLRLGSHRFRTEGEINTLALAPDGKTVAVCSNHGMMLFDADTGKRLSRMDRSEAVYHTWTKPLAFSGDGKRLAARWFVKQGEISKPGVRVWESARGWQARDYPVELAIWVGWSSVGEPLAVCLEHGGLRFHNLATGKSMMMATDNLAQPGSFTTVTCSGSSDGRILAVASDDRDTIDIWDTSTGKKRSTLRPKGAPVYKLSLSPDGKRLATSTRQAVQMWDIATGKTLHTVDSKTGYTPLVFRPDGKLLALMKSWGITFRDAATGREVGRTRKGYDLEETFHMSADGLTLATAERHSGAFHLFDVATGEEKRVPVSHRRGPSGLAFSPDGRRLVTHGGQDFTIHVWDMATSEFLARIKRPPQNWVRDIALSPDGRTLYSAWVDGTVWVSNAQSGVKLYDLQIDVPDEPAAAPFPLSLQLSADGSRLVVFSGAFPQKGGDYKGVLVTEWDTATRQQIYRRLQAGKVLWDFRIYDASIKAVPQSAKLAGPAGEVEVGVGPMRLEDVRSGEPLLTFPRLEGQTKPVAFSPDGRLLVSRTYKEERNTLHVWEAASASVLVSIPSSFADHPSFSPDGRLLSLEAPGKEILVWDLVRGVEFRRFKGYDASVTWLAISPDCLKLVSGHDDSTLLVWDLGMRPSAPVARLGEAGLEKAWNELAGSDAPRAYRARWALASSTETAISWMRDRLRPSKPADPKRLRQLMADLGSDQFAARSKAQAGLEEFGDLAEPALRMAIAENPTLEVRRRAQKVLESFRKPVTKPELLRPLRAVAVLEDIGTGAAQASLKELAEGTPDARFTREARASFERLERKHLRSR